MKLSITQEKFARSLGIVGRVVGSRSSLPILGNILLKAEGSELTVSATNLEIALSVHVHCKIERPGSVSVPAKLLQEVISSVQSEKLQLTSDGESLEVSAAHVNAKLQGMQADEFPATPEVQADQVVNLPSQLMKDLLERVTRAASLDESRPVLAGVLISSQAGILTLAATDSYRLAEEKVSLKDLHDFSVIIPIRTIQEVIRLIDPAHNDSIDLTIGTNEMAIQIGDVQLVSRLIDGSFPNYSQIIPSSSETSLTCRRDDLIGIVKLAGVFARENAHTIQLSVERDGIKIHAEAAQVGQNTSELPADVKGKTAQISLNARFLVDALTAFSEPEVELKFNDKLDPCVIIPVNKQAQSLHLIMPLRN
ncbi:MAG: DNA polymerase III subunit beta [bacterium]